MYRVHNEHESESDPVLLQLSSDLTEQIRNATARNQHIHININTRLTPTHAHRHIRVHPRTHTYTSIHIHTYYMHIYPHLHTYYLHAFTKHPHAYILKHNSTRTQFPTANINPCIQFISNTHIH